MILKVVLGFRPSCLPSLSLLLGAKSHTSVLSSSSVNSVCAPGATPACLVVPSGPGPSIILTGPADSRLPAHGVKQQSNKHGPFLSKEKQWNSVHGRQIGHKVCKPRRLFQLLNDSSL